MYSSILSLTSALDRGGWSTPLPDSSIPGKDIPYRRLGGPQGSVDGAENLYPTGIRTPDRLAKNKRCSENKVYVDGSCETHGNAIATTRRNNT